MLRSTDVAAVKKEVFNLFQEVPEIFCKVADVVTYEVVIYKAFVPNVGRGLTLRAALEQLKELNGLGGNHASKH